jgi:NAD(P)-dependent dehydrogenase (short-subunit alcohol dehydrogenase family)
MTKIIASALSDANILINSMCPGWVRTEMGGSNANRSVEEGADTAAWLATLPDNAKSGKFYRDRQEISW